MAPRTICLSEAEADSRYFYIPKDALQRHCPLNPGPPTFDGAPTIGAFARLPAELQLDVIEMLDFKSLLAFRRVNKEAANLVEGMSAWKLVSVESFNFSNHHLRTLVDAAGFFDIFQRVMPDCKVNSFHRFWRVPRMHSACPSASGHITPSPSPICSPRYLFDTAPSAVKKRLPSTCSIFAASVCGPMATTSQNASLR
jgi:hypothetical protein